MTGYTVWNLTQGGASGWWGEFMDSDAYEAGVRAALDGLFWYENPTGSQDWLDGHDSVAQAMKRGAWFTADVEAKRAARLINEEKTK